MSRKANPAMVGAFVVGAMVIMVAAILVLTSGQLFQQRLPVVMHFQGSVKGLNVGAPVSFRGVQIGTVKDIRIILSPKQDARIPVTAEIDLAAFKMIGYAAQMSVDEFRQSIDRSARTEGLRAQLQLQSLLTGQLFIQLDYFPGTEARFVESDHMPEIPTVPTPFQELSEMLQDFPTREVLGNLRKAVASIAELAGDENIRAAIQSVDEAFKDVSELVTNLDSRTRPLEPTLVEARRTLAQATTTLTAAEQTFVKATETLAPVRRLVADDSEVLEAIDETLAAMTDAARAIAALAETLERRPEAIFKGKGVLGGD